MATAKKVEGPRLERPRGDTQQARAGRRRPTDFHAVFAVDDVLYIGGHARAAVSDDNGKTWQDTSDLTGADAVGSGTTWEVRNAAAGQAFRGTIRVDPGDTDRLIVPDMSGALAIGSDGGRTWTGLG